MPAALLAGPDDVIATAYPKDPDCGLSWLFSHRTFFIMVPQTFTYSMRPIRDAEGIAHPQRDWASSAAGMPHPTAAAPTASQESLSITGPLFGPFCGFEVRSMFEFFL